MTTAVIMQNITEQYKEDGCWNQNMQALQKFRHNLEPDENVRLQVHFLFGERLPKAVQVAFWQREQGNTKEGNHSQASMLDLSLLESELTGLILTINQAQGVKVATCP